MNKSTLTLAFSTKAYFRLLLSFLFLSGLIFLYSTSIAQAQTYCSSNSTNASYEYIDRVELNGSVNSSSASLYSDFTDEVFTILTRGTTYSMTSVSMVVTQGGPWLEYVNAYIDFNQDGDFDEPYETIDFGNAMVTDQHTFTASFTVPTQPTQAPYGETRMRVVLQYNADPTACGSYTWGETEDYTIGIIQQVEYYCKDDDNDGHYDPAVPGGTCVGDTCWPAGCGIVNVDDCNDNDGSIHPEALESCGDGTDQNCNGYDEPCGGASSCDVDATGTYFEAEKYSSLGSDNWSVVSGSGGNGNAYLRGLLRDTNAPPSGTTTDFNMYFPSAGTYYIWFRVHNNNSTSNNELWYSLNGIAVNARQVYSDRSPNWQWTNKESSSAVPQTQLTIPTAGFHSISVWSQETDLLLDGIFISTNSTATPSFTATNIDPSYSLDVDGDGHSTIDSCAGTRDDCDDSLATGANNYPGNWEACDNQDNDCDAAIDENLSRSTTCGVGECAGNTGTEYCSAGVWGSSTCDPFAGATAETCDGLDNDCNGTVDDGIDVDADGDGHYAIGACASPADDCNDNDPDIYPGNIESCDNKDNNCDGTTDNFTRSTSCGVGACSSNTGTETCTSGVWGGDTCDPLAGATAEICDTIDNNCNGSTDEGLTTDLDGDGHTAIGSCSGSADDCNDNDPTIYPGNAESCDNKDNNCDGTVDDFSITTSCGQGLCTGNTGSQTCTAGSWGADSCDPFAGATTEILCNGVDEDCDGLTDDDENLDGDPVTSCNGDCNDNDPTIYPGNAESCDNKDNNCDGTVDDFSLTTSCGIGACSGNTGSVTCTAGSWGTSTCDPFAGATAEVTCNGIDEDCDGLADDDQNVDGDPVSVCAGDCNDNDPTIYPGNAESCDNKDNNCDGTVDDFSRATNCGIGACSSNTGTETCTAGAWSGDTCDPFAGATTEVTCNGIDEDCDGLADDDQNVDGDPVSVCSGDCNDNDPTIYPGNAEACDNKDNNCDGTVDDFSRATNCGIGACSSNTGTETCTAGAWSGDTCDPFAGATTEIVCNGIDEDCDGLTDDDQNVDGDPVSVCSGDCNDNDPTVYPGNAESCDNKDNNCDGTVDDFSIATSCGVGACSGNVGSQTCTTGSWSADTCDPFAGATAEVMCDGIDQNCNGLADDDENLDGDPVSFCSGDCNDSDPTIYPGNAESCDNKDNNCDGTIDDFSIATSCGIGACSGNTGSQTCTAGSWSADTCDPFAGATTEIECDGIDQNCNGTADDGPNADGDPVSVCAGDCNDNDPTIYPGNAESCDNKDNDCDGTVDNFSIATSCGQGACSGNTGSQTCTTGSWSADTCDPFAGASTEIMCDGIDQNCNGLADDDENADGDAVSFCNGDCNDNDPTAYQGAAEICDNKDNNCDGTIDDFSIATSCGIGECSGNTGSQTCTAGSWSPDTCDPFAGAITEVTCNGVDEDCDGLADDDANADGDPVSLCAGDCLDSDPTVYPGNAESCDNKDNNCDGTVDNFSIATSCGVGACSGNTGTQTCTNGFWLPDSCDPFAGAGTEVMCNGVDEDCDGLADDDENLDGDAVTSCNGDCNDNDPTVYPGNAESCDNKDNNCDGTVDDFSLSTSCGIGACSGNTGSITCTSGSWGTSTCDPFAGATTEIMCNGVDDDCDGLADDDENLDGDPVSSCNGDCNDDDPTVYPGNAESCDNKDNNCDGTIDDFSVATSCGIGACSGNTGSQSCTAGSWSADTCDPFAGSTTEVMCDGIDQDCDGLTDDDTNADGDAVTSCNGDCNDSDPAVYPGNAESCDNKDNDCDGTVDNFSVATSCGIGACSGNTGSQTCTAGSWSADSCDPFAGAITEVTCNGIDEDCDGLGDDDSNLDGDPVTSCNGDCNDNDPTIYPGNAESCDNKDNNCDGTVDDFSIATSCGVGACSGNVGSQTCTTGSWSADTCDPFAGATAETCDGVDNNCDGSVDEGLLNACGQCGVAADTDSDGIPDCLDNCDQAVNPGQEDCDNDGIGNLCDPVSACSNDSDADGITNDVDNCPDDYNPGQQNMDGDSMGNICDPCPGDYWNDTTDNDGICAGPGFSAPKIGDQDNCPGIANPTQTNADGDSLGDACDACPNDPNNDADGDGICGDVDTCPNDPANDADGDGICGDVDNCPTNANPGQENADLDLLGDVCDACPSDAANDADGDGVCGDVDNCPTASNAGQEDGDSDGLGNVCDTCPNDAANDGDGDGVCGDIDNCPVISNTNQSDNDGDGVGDLCDICASENPDDADSDGICAGGGFLAPKTGQNDNCPTTANTNQLDGDGDGLGDVCDTCPNDAANDADGDGVCGDVDNCPADTNATQANADGDALGDICDNCPNDPNNDQDGDGVCAGPGEDECPIDPAKQLPGQCGCGISDDDTDGDGIADCVDTCPADPDNDSDSDGVCGDVDNCPADANATQDDSDSDGAGDVCDTCPNDFFNDSDTDGVCGDIDNCPATSNPAQTDTDTDGLGDVCDICPGDAEDDADFDGICAGSGFLAPKTGDNDTCPYDAGNDSDGDGVCGDIDNCPIDANSTQDDLDIDGLGDICDSCPDDADNDLDSDGFCSGTGFLAPKTGDNDLCPSDIGKTEVGVCGCGVPDIDTDLDGTLDCNDGCPFDPYKIDPGVEGCGVVDQITVPTGTNVFVFTPVPELTLILDEVTTPCTLDVTVVPSTFNSSVFEPLGVKSYDIELNCPDDEESGLVCLNYDESLVTVSEERDIRLLRNDNQGLVDTTFSLDIDIDKVCARTDSFTVFGPGVPINSPGLTPDEPSVPAGTNVTVVTKTDPAGSVTFSGAIPDCNLSVFVMESPVPPIDYSQDPPVEYRLLGNEALDINTDCATNGEVCLDYDPNQVVGDESDLTIWHRDDINGWEDITTSIDTTNNIICGQTTSFSPFGVGEPSNYSGMHITPYPSALSSLDTDLVVEFEGKRSSCWEEEFDQNGIMYPIQLTCTLTWDFGGPGLIIGGNGYDTILYLYDAPGTYTATLTSTEDSSGLSASASVKAYALEVEPPPPTGDFSTSVTGKTVSISGDLNAYGIPDLPIRRVYLYWGDRTFTVLADDKDELPGNSFSDITHVYPNLTRDYRIRVLTLDEDRNELHYTINDDPDLAVQID